MSKPLSLYVHIPFCLRKCAYCDFYSISDYSIAESFVQAAIEELIIYSQLLSKPTLKSIFFGGGTPTSLDIKLFSKLFSAIKENYSFADTCEITIECNPASSDESKLAEYKQLGINRLSVGVQSFNDEELKTLGRLHDSQTAFDFISNALTIGFDSVSIDLIIALPGQSVSSLEKTLRIATSLPIEHISAYTLILEPNTPLFDLSQRESIKIMTEDEEADVYEIAVDYLIKAGFEQYEISNFAKDGKYSIHNLNYWNSGEYIGIGPSAHGYLGARRYSNFANLDKYISLLNSELKLPIIEENILSEWDKISEAFFLAFRAQGVNLQEYNNRFGLNLQEILAEEITLWSAEKFCVVENSILKLTPRGRALCDELSAIALKKIDHYYKKGGL